MSYDAAPLQHALIVAGPTYDPGPIDGVFGIATQAAMQRYQLDYGLEQTAYPDVRTLASLGLPPDLVPEVPGSHSKPKGLPMSNILGPIFSGLLSNLLNSTLIQSYLRNILMGAGGGLVTSGVISGSQLVTAVGAVMVLVDIVLSTVSANTKRKAMDVVKAVDAHPEIRLTPEDASLSGKATVAVKQ